MRDEHSSPEERRMGHDIQLDRNEEDKVKEGEANSLSLGKCKTKEGNLILRGKTTNSERRL